MAPRTDPDPRVPPLAPTLPFPVVGVGASAGGLEAAAGLLDGMPDDTGMAFVFVFHLDPSRESHLGDMPRPAIDTGQVDRVLPVDRRPALLADYGRGPCLLDVNDVDEGQLAELTMLLSARSAYDLRACKRPTVLRRVRITR
jgi:chemotaxis response regulator CheB